MNSIATSRIAAGIAALALLVASFLLGYGVGRSRPIATTAEYGLLEEAENRLISSALDEPDHTKLVQGAIKGMLAALGDPHAEYFDAATYEDFEEEISGAFSGVGLRLKQITGVTRVVSVLPNTPAAEVGMQAGDVVLEIHGSTVEGLTLEEVTQAIRGGVGTRVAIVVARGDQEFEFVLTRAEIEIPSVESKMLEGSTGFVRVGAFTSGTAVKARRSVVALRGRGAKGFILDLRGNPGGVVSEAASLAGIFLDGGVVFSFMQRGKPAVVQESTGEFITDLPIVVLVDEGSASAAEIVAGAIQDRRRGIIAGQHTYGKGSIQTVFELSDGSAVKLTTASYFTPSGRSIGEAGISPDVSVQSETEALARALEILGGLVAGTSDL